MVMSYLDADGSGEIDLEEFTAAFKVNELEGSRPRLTTRPIYSAAWGDAC
jgi:hypothetical protein